MHLRIVMVRLVLTLSVTIFAFVFVIETAFAQDCSTVRLGFTQENEKFIQDFRVRTERNGYWGYSSVEAMQKIGVIGDVYAYGGTSEFDDGDFSLSGYYLRLKKIPALKNVLATQSKFEITYQFKDVSSWPILNDKRAQELIHSLLGKVPVLLTPQTQFLGMVPMSSHDPLRRNLGHCIFGLKNNEPFVVLTPQAEYYAIVHELVHYEDVVSGLSNKVRDELKALSLSENELGAISSFIVEHRAYHREYERLQADIRAGVKFKKIDPRHEQTQDQRIAELVPAVLHHYLLPLKFVLESKKTNEKLRSAIIAILKSHSPLEGELGLKSILEELFK